MRAEARTMFIASNNCNDVDAAAGGDGLHLSAAVGGESGLI